MDPVLENFGKFWKILMFFNTKYVFKKIRKSMDWGGDTPQLGPAPYICFLNPSIMSTDRPTDKWTDGWMDTWTTVDL